MRERPDQTRSGLLIFQACVSPADPAALGCPLAHLVRVNLCGFLAPSSPEARETHHFAIVNAAFCHRTSPRLWPLISISRRELLCTTLPGLATCDLFDLQRSKPVRYRTRTTQAFFRAFFFLGRPPNFPQVRCCPLCLCAVFLPPFAPSQIGQMSSCNGCFPQ